MTVKKRLAPFAGFAISQQIVKNITYAIGIIHQTYNIYDTRSGIRALFEVIYFVFL